MGKKKGCITLDIYRQNLQIQKKRLGPKKINAEESVRLTTERFAGAEKVETEIKEIKMAKMINTESNKEARAHP